VDQLRETLRVIIGEKSVGEPSPDHPTDVVERACARGRANRGLDLINEQSSASGLRNPPQGALGSGKPLASREMTFPA
jgi:hypothetical protein